MTARLERFSEVGLVAASFLLPCGLFIVDAAQSYQRTMQEGQRTITSTADLFEQHARNEFELCKIVLTLLNENIRGKTWEELGRSRTLHDLLVGLVHDHPQIGGLALIDAAGFIRVSSFPVPSPAPSFADRADFMALRDHDLGTYLGQRVHSRLEAGDKLSIVQRRTTSDGTFDGILLVDVTPAVAFVDFWEKGPTGGVTALVRTDGGYLARYPGVDLDLTTVQVDVSLFASALMGQRTYTNITSPADHLIRMTSLQPVQGVPAVLFHGMTAYDILSPWRAQLGRDGFLYGSATAGLVTLALLANSRRRRETLTRRRLTQQSHSLAEEVTQRKRAEGDLQTVLFDIVNRQEEDRIRIARDLHDSLGQHVALLLLSADTLGRSTENTSQVQQQITHQKQIATEISRELSRIAWDLRPVWLDDMGLEAAVTTFIDIMRERSGLQFTLDCSIGDCRFSPAVEATFYRGLQEAVTNIIKHAEATRVIILLDISNGDLRLMIEDDGKGFPSLTGPAPGLGGSPKGGLGLRGIRERLAMVEGSLLIESEPGNGAALTLRSPA